MIQNTNADRLPYLSNGTILNGRYVIDQVLGSGGFGVTYKARDGVLNMVVAIKEYFPKSIAGRTPGDTMMNAFTDADSVEFDRGIKRFLQEAQDLARFNNKPGIVSIYDFFRDNNTAYMVMEYLEGCTLKEYLHSYGERIDVATGLYIVENLLATLTDMHSAGFIHRDISPDNIFICIDSSVKLLDFGAAKWTMNIYDQTVSVVLKHGYAPPEQYMSRGEFGPWTDIYALGATMYRMLTGTMPPESVERVVSDNIIQPSVLNREIPQYLNDVILKAMAVKAEDRYRSAADMRNDMNIETHKQQKKLKIVLFGSLAAAIAVIAVCLGVMLVSSTKSTNRQSRDNTNGNAVTESTYDVGNNEGEQNAAETGTGNTTDTGNETGAGSEANAGTESGTEAGTTDSIESTTDVDSANNAQTVNDAGLPMPDETGDPIYIYSWNDELGEKLAYVKEKYPQYADRIKFVNLETGTTSEYVDTLEDLLSSGASDAPSIFACDDSLARYFFETEYVVPVSQVGITDAMYSESFSYTKEFATINNSLMGLTWQATPGSFVYRTDIAREVLGTDDPEKVQAYVSDWDTFLDTAKVMKQAGYTMLSSGEDLQDPVLSQRTSGYIRGNALVIDESIKEYINLNKQLYSGGYSNNTASFSQDWMNDMSGNVFGYFGCTWFVYDTLSGAVDSSLYGNYNICQGPVSYYWGGTYLSVTNRCTDTKLAALVMYTLCCDTDVMYEIQANGADFVNNKTAVDTVIAEGKENIPVLAGDNHLSVWRDSAEKINASYATKYDYIINSMLVAAANDYNYGVTNSLEEAIEEFKDLVRQSLTWLSE